MVIFFFSAELGGVFALSRSIVLFRLGDSVVLFGTPQFRLLVMRATVLASRLVGSFEIFKLDVPGSVVAHSCLVFGVSIDISVAT